MKMNMLLILMISLLSCDENNARFGIGDRSMKEEFAMAAAPDEAAANDYSIREGNLSDSPAPITSIEKKLIKNGSMRLKVENVKIAKGKIDNICKSFSAYTASENQDNFEDRLEYTHSIRVPAQHFDSIMMALEKVSIKVDGKNVRTEDVTAEFIDIETRLNTKKELENRYREILKQAKTVTDILSIESQIATVRSEIESMEGRLNYYKNQVSFSTIDLTYYEILGTDFGFGSKLANALGNGWDNLLWLFIGLINIWPFVILLGGSIVWIWRRIRARAARLAATGTK